MGTYDFENNLTMEPQAKDKKGSATASLIIGLVGIIVMLVPFINIINIPLQAIGGTLGVLSRKSSKRGFAVTGIVLSSITLVVSLVISVAALSMFGNIMDNAKQAMGIPLDESNMERIIKSEGGIVADLDAKKADGSAPSDKELEATKLILQRRLGDSSKKYLITVDKATGRLHIMLAVEKGENPETELNNTIRIGQLTFQEIDENQIDSSTGNYLPTGKIIVSGSEVKEVSLDLTGNGTDILIQFNEAGAKKFEEATGRLVGKPVGIFMDEDLISAPIVQCQIQGGTAMINGQRSVEEAQTLISLICSGTLDVKLEITDKRVYMTKSSGSPQ